MPTPPAAHSFRAVLETGALYASIHLHDVVCGPQTLRCWTIVSEGLTAVGQRELALTLVRDSDDPTEFPRGIVEYLRAVRTFAREGRFVNDGGFSGYAAPGPFGFGEFVGVAFQSCEPADIDLPADALHGVLLTEGEFEMAHRCSGNRVLSKLGELSRYFPFPYWSDPRRQSAYAVGDAEHSLLSKMGKAVRPAATATLLGNDLTLRISIDDAGPFADEIGQGNAVALLPGRDANAASALVWAPGQSEPLAIAPDTGRGVGTAAWFVAFVPADADTVRFMEDGYAVVLSPSTAARVTATLRDGGRLRVRDTDSSRTLIVICS